MINLLCPFDKIYLPASGFSDMALSVSENVSLKKKKTVSPQPIITSNKAGDTNEHEANPNAKLEKEHYVTNFLEVFIIIINRERQIIRYDNNFL